MFVLITIGLGGFGLVAWVSTHPPVAPPAHAAAALPPPPPAKKTVLIAARPLRAGSLIKPEDLGEKEFPVTLLQHGASDNTPQARGALYGAMVRRSLAPGEVIAPEDVMRPGDHGFLAAVLQPGMRAMTIGLNSIASDASLIWPGDHVDMILTQQVEKNSAPMAKRIFGETVLTDVRVIAIDQQLVEGGSADPAEHKGAKTLTLEVTQEQAERLTVALRLGKLALVVRSAERASAEAKPAAPQTVWAGDVSPALGHEAAPNPGVVVHIWQGSADSKEFRF
jgi:pilus assembly protein CpaB